MLQSSHEVVAKITDTIKFQTRTVANIVYKADGSYGEKAYWEAKAPSEGVVWVRGAISRSKKAAV
jgi:hypothetical protein